MAPGLRQFTERRGDGAGEPVLDNENGEELMYVQPGVSIVIGNRSPESQGTVYISTKKVVWLSDVDRTKGYAVDFLSLSLHAVSRDPEAYSSPCIYTQIETGEDGNESEDSDSESSDALDLSKVTEMRLVPSDPGQLDTLFQILCDCAELNPEPIEDDEEHNWIFSANQLADETAGKGLEQLAWYLLKNSFVSSILAIHFVSYFFLQKGKILNGISLKTHQVQLVIQMGIMTSLVQCLSSRSMIIGLKMQRRWNMKMTVMVTITEFPFVEHPVVACLCAFSSSTP